MKKSVWVAALAVGLYGITTKSVAQDAVWRSVSRPGSTKARGVSTDSPRAILGKPVPITRGASAEPRPFPEVYRTESLPQRPVYTGIEPIATVAPPGAVIAASAPMKQNAPVPTAWETPAELAPIGDLFAMDRPTTLPVRYSAPNHPPLPVPETNSPAAPMPTGSDAGKIGNWLGTFSMQPPAPVMPVESPFLCDPCFGEELPPTKWYVRGEYLLWWMKNDRVPPLVTTTSILNPPPPLVPAAIGSPGTEVLFGDSLDRNPFSGGRFVIGYYLDDCGEKAIELTGFFLGPQSTTFGSDSFRDPVLARPFLRANDLTQDVEFVSFPGAAVGKIEVNAPSQMWGLEPNLLYNWCCGCDYRIDLIGGFRYVNLTESLTIEENVIFADNLTLRDGSPSPLAGARFFVKDRFACSNQFYGGQVGIEGRWQRDRLTVDARLKIAMGVTQQQLQVEGLTTVNNMNPVPGGLLALPSNIGNFSQDRFSVIPEGTLSVGYYLTDRLRAMVGYNFLYWSDVVRPGGQIDPVLDVTQVPSFDNGGFAPTNPPRPAPTFKSTDFWVQGINFGLEYRY